MKHIMLLSKNTFIDNYKYKKLNINCINCDSPNIKRTGHSSTGFQRYQCKDCNKSFQLDKKKRKPKKSTAIGIKCIECQKEENVIKSGLNKYGI